MRDLPVPEKLLQEKCGLIGIYTPRASYSVPLALTAAGGVQHRGQHGVGLVLRTNKEIFAYKRQGLIKDIFTTPVISEINRPSSWVFIHTRYGTSGGYQESNVQPCVVTTETGEQCVIAHNGDFAGIQQVRKKLKVPVEPGTSDTYIFARYLAQEYNDSWDETIKTCLSELDAAYSLLIGTKDHIYVARDPFGIRPLALGKISKGWIIASETFAFDKIDAKMLRFVEKGEILKIGKDGLKTLKKGVPDKKGCFCDFEWAYFARPESLFPTGDTIKDKQNWLSVYRFRERCGQFLAKEIPVQKPTFVAGIPDSGLAIANGFAQASGVPYRHAILRDHADMHGSHRLFMTDNEKHGIKHKVIGKLSLVPDPAIWKNAKVVLCDDSIVRGNVSAKITRACFYMGAKEVHWVVGYPPVMHRCHLGVSIRTKTELIASLKKGDPKRIAQEIGATSVTYISPTSFVRARLPDKAKVEKPADMREVFLRNGGCGGCVTGLYPVGKDGKRADVFR